MTLEAVRDVIIIVSGILGIISLIILVSIAVSLYSRAAQVLDSARDTINTIRGTTSFISDLVVKPTIQVVSLVHGLRGGLLALLGLSRKGRRGKGG